MTLQSFLAVWLTTVWSFVVFAAVLTRDSALIGLSTALTPLMLLPAGWLFGKDYLKTRAHLREEHDAAPRP